MFPHVAARVIARRDSRRPADLRTHDDGHSVGAPEEPLDRCRAGRLAPVEGDSIGISDIHEHRGEAARFTPGRMSCSNCHLNAGQREKSLPLVGVVGMFPEYNRRSGRLFTLGDRIVDCFLRSQNATGTGVLAQDLPSLTAKEVLAVSAYLTWLSKGFEVGNNPPWRGQNAIATANLIPIEKLDPAKGEAIFTDRCTTCHGVDGQGVAIGDKKPGPLWGADSWNDGAGAARVYTLAGIIRYRCRT